MGLWDACARLQRLVNEKSVKDEQHYSGSDLKHEQDEVKDNRGRNQKQFRTRNLTDRVVLC